MCPSEAEEKNAFLKLSSRDLVHIFLQHFTKNPLLFYDKQIGYYQVIPLTFFSFEPFAKTIRICGH